MAEGLDFCKGIASVERFLPFRVFYEEVKGELEL